MNCSDNFEYQTTLNGGVVSVWLKVHTDEDGKSATFDKVFYEGADVTRIVSNEQLMELEMEALKGFAEAGWETANGY